MVRFHAIRLRRIPEGVSATEKPEDGVFPDSLRTLARITETEIRNIKRSRQWERHYKVIISGNTLAG